MLWVCYWRLCNHKLNLPPLLGLKVAACSGSWNTTNLEGAWLRMMINKILQSACYQMLWLQLQLVQQTGLTAGCRQQPLLRKLATSAATTAAVTTAAATATAAMTAAKVAATAATTAARAALPLAAPFRSTLAACSAVCQPPQAPVFTPQHAAIHVCTAQQYKFKTKPSLDFLVEDAIVGPKLAEMKVLMRTIKFCGVSEGAMQAIHAQAARWPSLSRDRQGLAQRISNVHNLLGVEAGNLLLERAPGVLTRVPDALAAQINQLSDSLGLKKSSLGGILSTTPLILDIPQEEISEKAGLIKQALGVAASQAVLARLTEAAPQWLTYSPVSLQQRLDNLVTFFEGQDISKAVQQAPVLITLLPATVATRVDIAKSVFLKGGSGGSAASELTDFIRSNPALLTVKADVLTERSNMVNARLPGLSNQQLAQLLTAQQLHWEQLDFLQHTGLVTSDSTTQQQQQQALSQQLQSMDIAKQQQQQQQQSGSNHTSQMVDHAVAVTALTTPEEQFAQQWPAFQGWRAAREISTKTPAAWGWREEFERGFEGENVMGWLQQMQGKWLRVLWLRFKNEKWWAGGSSKAGQTGSSQPNITLSELAAMSDESFCELEPGFRLQVPPMLADLPQVDVLPLLTGTLKATKQCVQDYLAVWGKIAQAVDGQSPWQEQLTEWRLVGGNASGNGNKRRSEETSGNFATALSHERAAFWPVLMQEADKRLQRLDYLRLTKRQHDLHLWHALSAPAAQFNHQFPLYSIWADLVALIGDKEDWLRELRGSMEGGALDEWLGVVAARRDRLEFLVSARGGDGWRAMGLREAVALDDDSFQDIFPESRYSAWRALAQLHEAMKKSEGAAVSEESVMFDESNMVTSMQPGSVWGGAGNGDGGAGTPVGVARLQEFADRSYIILDYAERHASWDQQACSWDAKYWTQILQGFVPHSKQPRLDFVLQSEQPDVDPLGVILQMPAGRFDQKYPQYATWQHIKSTLAKSGDTLKLFTREFEQLHGAALLELLLCVGKGSQHRSSKRAMASMDHQLIMTHADVASSNSQQAGVDVSSTLYTAAGGTEDSAMGSTADGVTDTEAAKLAQLLEQFDAELVNEGSSTSDSESDLEVSGTAGSVVDSSSEDDSSTLDTADNAAWGSTDGSTGGSTNDAADHDLSEYLNSRVLGNDVDDDAGADTAMTDEQSDSEVVSTGKGANAKLTKSAVKDLITKRLGWMRRHKRMKSGQTLWSVLTMTHAEFVTTWPQFDQPYHQKLQQEQKNAAVAAAAESAKARENILKPRSGWSTLNPDVVQGLSPTARELGDGGRLEVLQGLARSHDAWLQEWQGFGVQEMEYLLRAKEATIARLIYLAR